MTEQTPQYNRQTTEPVSHDYLLDFGVFLKKYWLSIVTGLAIVTLALLGWSFFRARAQQQQIQAISMLALAQTPEQFEEIISQHPGTQASAMALLALASRQHTMGKYDQAQASYHKFLAANENHAWANMARLGLIACLEGQGSLNEAASQYENFAVKQPDDFLAPQALLGKARCLHALNRLDDAIATYENIIVSSQTNSLWRRQAETMLELVERDVRAQQRIAAGQPKPTLP